MDPLGIGIVGTGNIAGGYARNIPTHPSIRLVAATDLDPDRAAAFGEANGCRIHGSLDELLADPEVDIVVNLTVQHAHYERHAPRPRGREARLQREADGARARRGAGADRRSPGDTASASAARPRRSSARRSRRRRRGSATERLGTIRAVYADVSHGRIETWHPSPEGFFDVGVLVDVAVYPLTLVTTMIGPATSMRAWGWDLMPDRVTVDGRPFRIGSPDLIVAAVELEGGAVLRLTASFYVGRPAKHRGGLEFHGDAGSLALGQLPGLQRAGRVRSVRRRVRGGPVRAAAVRGDRVGPRRRGPRVGDRRGPATPRIGRAGGARRRHPRAAPGRSMAADGRAGPDRVDLSAPRR